MIVWDVNTGKVIDRTACDVPVNWFTTAEGWTRHKEEAAIMEEEIRIKERAIIFRER